jgi:PAS domain S-box-containing protein
MPPRLIAAMLLPFVVCALQWTLWDYLSPYVWFLFFPAAYVSAWLGGLWGGLAGTAIAAVLVWYVFMPPALSFALDNPSAGFSILIFLVMGALFAVFFERLRRAQASSETRFEAVFEQALVGMAYVGLDGRWLRVNDAFCRIVGYDRTELRALHTWELTHPDDRVTDRDGARGLLAGDRTDTSREKRCLHKDGRIRWIRLSVALVRKPNGAPDYFIAIIEDIQARKEAEDAMRKSEELMRSFFENAESLVWVKDLDGRFLQINRYAEQVIGRPREAILGQTVAALFPESEANDFAENDRQVIAQDHALYFEETALLSDGPHRYLSTKFPLHDSHGQMIGLGAICTDITARRQAEEARMESEARYRDLVEGVNSAILCWSHDGQITFVNPFAEHLFGWSAEEVIGQPVSMLVPEQDSTGTDLTGMVREIASHPERYLNTINENICRDGRRLWMSWTNRALRDAGGQVTGILAVGNDITARRRAEEDLRLRNDELEQFSQASIGRERQMIELKRQINGLSRELGREPPFDLSFADTLAAPAERPRP